MESEPRFTTEELEEIMNREDLIMEKYKLQSNTIIFRDVNIKIKDLYSNEKQ